MGSETRAFGELLRRYRRAAELTQEGLAERAGISGRAVRAMEAGEPHRPRPDTLALLLEALAIPEEEQETFRAAAGRLGQVAPTLAPAQVRAFLVADLRGYTAFTHERGDEAAARLTSRFAKLAQEVVAQWGGELIEARGDEVLAGFGSARGALRAALALQQACLGATEQEPSLPLRMGMGLDAGEAVPVEGGYRGGALNLAARLCSLAGPGEVFASEGAIHLARAMEDLTHVDRGVVELKGLPDPVRVIQVVKAGEEPAHAPRFGLQPRDHTTLPVQPTCFIGREREVAEIVQLLQHEAVRLLTLTGPGGVGKTRLAVEVAGYLAERFPDGITYVSLASLADPALVPSTIASALDLKEAGSAPILDTLIQHLQATRLLLVLDNFEHLLEAANVVSQLLVACPQLTILITSRAVLHLAAEREYPVPPFPVPSLGQMPEPAALSDCDAIRLFVQRAQAARPAFQLTEENATSVVEICQRLDGLPLALELAAARTRIFSPRALLARLSSRLGLLTGGSRDVPARQQTLRNTLDWSYHLLSPEEQTLFARLSVFAGGCTLEAAEAVCDPDGAADVLQAMTSLVEQSLLQQEGEEEPSFRMLETVREYGGEKLVEHGEDVQTRNAHARFFLQLAQAAEPEVRGPHQGEWLDRLEMGHDNLRAALRWLLDRGQIAAELRLASALRRFWAMRGYSREGLQWLEAGLARDNGVEGAIRARALYGAADLLAGWGENQRAIRLLDEALRLGRELGDRETIARTLRYLGRALLRQGDVTQASRCYEESVGLFRDLEDRWGMTDALHGLALIAQRKRDFETAEAHYREVLELARKIGDGGRIAIELYSLGDMWTEQGKYEEARPLLEESLALIRELDRKDLLIDVLDSLGCVVMHQGDFGRAAELFAEGLSLRHDPRNKEGLLYILGHMAELAALQGKALRAVQLAGAAALGRDATASYKDPVEQEHLERALSRARQELGEDAFRLAWEECRSMTLEEAVACALNESGQAEQT